MSQETDKSQSRKRLQNKTAKEMVLAELSYTPIPNNLREAWRKGIISQKCYDLVHECFEHSENFWLRDDYLLSLFGNSRGTLLKARKEAIARNLIKVHRVRVKKSFINHYELLTPDQWDLSTVQKCTIEDSDSVEVSTVEISTVQNSTVEICTALTRKTPNKKKIKKKKEEVRDELLLTTSDALLSSKEESQNNAWSDEMRNLREEFRALKKEDPPQEKPKPQEVYGVELKAIGPEDCKKAPISEKKANGIVWSFICLQSDRGLFPGLLRSDIFDIIKTKVADGHFGLFEERIRKFLFDNQKTVLISSDDFKNETLLRDMVAWLRINEEQFRQ